MQLGAPTSGPGDEFDELCDDVTDTFIILEIDKWEMGFVVNCVFYFGNFWLFVLPD